MTTRPASRPVLPDLAAELDDLLSVADARLAAGYRPDPGLSRQPVHTAYVPAHKFGPDTIRLWGGEALAALEEFAATPAEFAVAFNLGPELAEQVLPLVAAKLATEPVEDLRIDFEDGYGTRSDDTEDAHARAAARALRASQVQDGGAPLAGLRCKSLEPATRRRALATIGAFLGAFAESGGELPRLVITLPKVTSAAQVTAMNVICQRFESAYGLVHPQRLSFEVQVELPQLLLGADGTAPIAQCVHAGQGRLTGLHFGTYDYSAAIGISAAYQSLDHPAADYAKAVMQVAVAGTGVRLSDGSTNAAPAGSRDEVITAWQLHARLVRRSLERGFYQGWDLHPAQLASRYAATFAFYRHDLASACDRLRAYADRAGAGLEEPATGKALASYLGRGLDCGAYGAAEVTERTGLEPSDLRYLRRRGMLP
ncbi:MAG TPA: aldolase [Streptosporangiaceae bacterium]|jgi:citrate lyase beta subunit|nr:aldolase [Streptosporangiaceae bacterium]